MINGNFIGERVRDQKKRPFSILLTVYDSRLADTYNTVEKKVYNVTEKFLFPQSYRMLVNKTLFEDPFRYSISVSIRDPRNLNQLVWLTDTQTLIEANRTSYDLYLKKIGV